MAGQLPLEQRGLAGHGAPGLDVVADRLASTGPWSGVSRKPAVEVDRRDGHDPLREAGEDRQSAASKAWPGQFSLANQTPSSVTHPPDG